ncbi:MAG TPA: 5'-methylthioadenosine/S-adenosylhomocysteine nucleosidase [Anaerolineales bacterium]|nr:5'-methylthioadenosine/S-adenosylhomocysteine nucleosidase [Anaerolineales bacterium]
MKALVIVSANAEWRVVKELYPDLILEQSPFGEFADLTLDIWHLTLFHGGWGKVSAAASAQYALDRFQPDLLVNLGTCGGFADRIKTGTIILVEQALIYDIIEQMGDGAEAIEHYASSLDLSWLPSKLPYPVSRGLLVSADRDIVAEDIPMLIEKYGAVAADWESGAIAWVAQKNKTRCLILRGVSDLVGGDGGEAYGNLELFHQRTKMVMKQLFDQLPDWLTCIEKPVVE